MFFFINITWNTLDFTKLYKLQISKNLNIYIKVIRGNGCDVGDKYTFRNNNYNNILFILDWKIALQ